ncbi:hypothetical protein BDW68DRAFT_183759 [Aspergillus falconensis]
MSILSKDQRQKKVAELYKLGETQGFTAQYQQEKKAKENKVCHIKRKALIRGFREVVVDSANKQPQGFHGTDGTCNSATNKRKGIVLDDINT